MQECMVLEQEWQQQMAEKYYLLEEQKEERSYPHRSQLCDLFFYFLTNQIFNDWANYFACQKVLRVTIIINGSS